MRLFVGDAKLSQRRDVGFFPGTYLRLWPRRCVRCHSQQGARLAFGLEAGLDGVIYQFGIPRLLRISLEGAACEMGLEGIGPKRLGGVYSSGIG